MADNEDLDASVIRLRAVLVHAKQTFESAVNAMAAGNVEHRTFDSLLVTISQMLREIDTAAALPGIAQFIRNLYGNQDINLGTHATAIITAATTAASTIRTSAPTGAQSFVLGYQYNADPRAIEPRTWRTYTSVQTETIRVQLTDTVTAITNFFRAVTSQNPV